MAAGSQEACHDPVIALVGDLLVTNLDPALLALADDQEILNYIIYFSFFKYT